MNTKATAVAQPQPQPQPQSTLGHHTSAASTTEEEDSASAPIIVFYPLPVRPSNVRIETVMEREESRIWGFGILDRANMTTACF